MAVCKAEVKVDLEREVIVKARVMTGYREEGGARLRNQVDGPCPSYRTEACLGGREESEEQPRLYEWLLYGIFFF